jgi:hypothetical protein
MMRSIERLSRVAFAFVLMNFAAAAGPVFLWRHRPMWR